MIKKERMYRIFNICGDEEVLTEDDLISRLRRGKTVKLAEIIDCEHEWEEVQDGWTQNVVTFKICRKCGYRIKIPNPWVREMVKERR